MSCIDFTHDTILSEKVVALLLLFLWEFPAGLVHRFYLQRIGKLRLRLLTWVKVAQFQLWLFTQAEEWFIWALSLLKLHLADICLIIKWIRTYHVWLIRHNPVLLFDIQLVFTRSPFNWWILIFHKCKFIVSVISLLNVVGKSTLNSVILQTAHGRLIQEVYVFLLNDALVRFLRLDLGQYIITDLLILILNNWGRCFWLIHYYFLWIVAYQWRLLVQTCKDEVINATPQNMLINWTLSRWKVFRVV